MLTAADIEQVMEKVRNMCDNRYVAKDVCNDRHAQEAQEMTELKLQVAKIATQTSALLKVCGFMAGGIGTLLIGAIGSLIIK